MLRRRMQAQHHAERNEGRADRVTETLAHLFDFVLALRFAYVFLTHPLDHRFSDPLRHWLNGQRFFAPDIMGSIDPLLYQVFLLGVQRLTGEDHWGVAACIGALSALMPWFWYKALRELLPRRWALGGALVIAMMPSLTMIYSYFMNETLLLTLMGAGAWLSLRALRKGTLGAFAWAALVWALASYTRMIAVPIAGFFLFVLLIAAPEKRLPRAGIALLFYVLLAVPACWHSSLRLNYCTPFGMGELNRAYSLSQAKGIIVHVKGDGERNFFSPALHHTPLAPFSEWQSARDGVVEIHVDPARGRADWDAEIARAEREQFVDFGPLGALRENAILLWFDRSWPDDNPDYLMGRLTMANRWLWPPLAVVVMVMGFAPSLPWKARLFPLLSLGLIVLLTVQSVGIVEGRYRKPLEPLLLASLTVLLFERRKRTLLRNVTKD